MCRQPHCPFRFRFPITWNAPIKDWVRAKVFEGGGGEGGRRGLKQCKDELFILLADNQTLHFFVEVLHAHAQPIKAFGA